MRSTQAQLHCSLHAGQMAQCEESTEQLAVPNESKMSE